MLKRILFGYVYRYIRQPVVVAGHLLEGGLYHFKVRVLTLDDDTLVLPAHEQTAYEDSLSIGNSENKTISIGDKQVPVNIISYYDKLKDSNLIIN